MAAVRASSISFWAGQHTWLADNRRSPLAISCTWSRFSLGNRGNVGSEGLAIEILSGAKSPNTLIAGVPGLFLRYYNHQTQLSVTPAYNLKLIMILVCH